MLNCLSDFDQMLDTVKVKLLHITTAVSSSSSPQPHATSMTATSDIVTSIDNDLQCALLQYQKLLLLYGSEKTSKEIQHQDGAVPQPAPALNDEDPEIQTSPQLQQLDLDSLALENTRKGQKEEVFECEEEVADNDTKVDKSNQTLTRSERISARKAQMERDVS